MPRLCTAHLLLLAMLFLAHQPSCSQTGRVPDLRLESLNHGTIELGDLLHRGPVYISFWALWCEPCKTELKALQKFHETYGREGLTILAINRDTQKSLAKVRAYLSAKGYTFTVCVDPDAEIFERLNGEALPYSLLVAPDGTIAYTATGFLPGDEKKIEREINKLLTTPPPATEKPEHQE